MNDTGIGMDQDLLKRLFRIFGTVSQLEERSFITTQGIGLGLTICRQICDKLTGTIRVQSQPQNGTQVTFSVPYKCLTCYGTDFNRAPSADAESVKRKDDKRSTKQSGHPVFNEIDAADTSPLANRNDSMKMMDKNNNRSDLEAGTPPLANQRSVMIKRQPFGGVAYAKAEVGSSKQTIYKGLTTNEPTVPLQSDSNGELGTQKGNTHDAILQLDNKQRGQTQEIKHVAKISKNSLPLHKQQESSLTEKVNQSLGFRAVARVAAKEKSKFVKKTDSKKRSRLGKEDVMNSMVDSSDSRFINDTSYFFSSQVE